MDTLYGNLSGIDYGNHIRNPKKKKPNVRFNILDEGYPLDNEGIA
jgi:hypothetical protein